MMGVAASVAPASVPEPLVSALQGPVAPWGRWRTVLLVALVLLGLWLRLRGLSAEGFADDEIHKWLAVNRYLHGDFGGDDIEHPMLMKLLITACLLIGRQLAWAPETMTRLPNVLFGTLTIWATAVLGRRLFGRSVGLISAGLAACSTTLIGYQRIAKEDTLLGFFLMLMLLFLCEAKVAADDGRTRDQSRSEILCAVALGAMLASKYFLFFAPIPVLAYLCLLPTGTAWRISWKRWAVLLAIAFATFAALNWTPFMPSSWRYGLDYMAEKKTISGSLFFAGGLYHNLPSYWLAGTPPWFYFVFYGVKFGPLTVALAIVGFALSLWRREPADRVLLTWMLWWLLILCASGSKWGRFTLSFTPAFLLCAAHGLVESIRMLRRPQLGKALIPIAGILVAGLELRVALEHFPHYRLYVNALGGGDDAVEWYFPHCDYFDTGLREALAHVARTAEPGAEVVSEVDWPVRYYLDRFGRADLTATMLRPEVACASGKVCYVVVQTGRLYFANQAALENLATRTPWYVEPVNGRPTVRIYRLAPGEHPFPAQS